MRSTDPALSNSLTDLAARIKIEHEATGAALRRSVEHAMACGDLLIEAKSQLQHGQWLPWLKDNCGIGARMAQKYMRLADCRAEIEAKCESNSYLTIRQALTLLTESVEAVERVEMPAPGASWDWDEIVEWGTERLNSPFDEWDLADYRIPENSAWFRTKMLHQFKLPTLAEIGLMNLMDDKSGLRLCAYDDLWEALRIIARFAKDDAAHGFRISANISGDAHLRAAVRMKYEARRFCGFLWMEIEHREKLTEAELSAERGELCQRWIADSEHKLAELGDPEIAGELTL